MFEFLQRTEQDAPTMPIDRVDWQFSWRTIFIFFEGVGIGGHADESDPCACINLRNGIKGNQVFMNLAMLFFFYF